MVINNRVFWMNVRSFREKLGWSQLELAQKLGLDPKNYNNKERGFAAKLPIDLAEQIAGILGTTIEELSKGDAPEEPLVSPEVANFWRNVRIRREKLQLSQKDMATKLGISPQNWQTKESGKATRLSSELAQKVADALECTVDELKEEEGLAGIVKLSLIASEKQERSLEIVTEKTKETLDSSSSSYDISHLPPFVQRFLGNKDYEDLITNFVGEQLEYLSRK